MENNTKLTSRILIILKYLWETTDETHTASLADIAAHLEIQGLSADSRTLKKDIEQLVEFGIDIVKDRKAQNQYHIASRHFQVPEVKLLIDAVQSARFITKKKSHELIEKLDTFVAPNHKQVLQRHLYIDARFKSVNENIYRTVDSILDAIIRRSKITFQYYGYSPEKNREYRHDGQHYSVSPYAMLWNNDAYYIVGYHDTRDTVAKFRVDRIANLEVTDTTIVRKPEDFDVSDFFTQEFSMLNGKACEVELLCENTLMNSIIDRFGEQVHTEIVDGIHFKAKVMVDLSTTFYGWVFASAGKMRIQSPPEAVDGFATMLRKYN